MSAAGLDGVEGEWERLVAEAEGGWAGKAAGIARAFEGVIREAQTSAEWTRRGRQKAEVSRWIERRLRGMLYVPRLVCGGEDEVL